MYAFFYKSTIKKLFLLSTSIYFIGFLLGIILVLSIHNIDSSVPTTTISSYSDAEKNMSDTRYILSNNLFYLSMLLAGSISLGIFTFVNLLYNGVLLGAQIYLLLTAGCPVYKILLCTVPHGIFEIPGILCASTAGFKLPYEVYRYFTNKKGQLFEKDDLLDILILAGIAVLLIVVAAFVESTITYYLVKHVILGE